MAICYLKNHLTSKRLEMCQMRVISAAGVLEVRQGDYYEADGRL